MNARVLASLFVVFFTLVSSAQVAKTEAQIKADYYKGFRLLQANPSQYFVRASDKHQLKIAYSVVKSEGSRQVVVIVPGYTESPYKYCELIADLNAKGFHVVAMSLRGMGLSQRYHRLRDMDRTTNLATVHVDDFQDYVKDVRYLLGSVVNQAFPGDDVFIFAHSTGGLVSAFVLPEAQRYNVKAAVFNSPLMGLPTGFWSRLLLDLERSVTSSRYAPSPLAKLYDPKTGKFSEQTDTNHEGRWTLYNDLLATNPEAVQSMPSRNWIQQVERSTTSSMLKTAAKHSVPLILFQAGGDTYVDIKTQDEYLTYHGEAGGNSVMIHHFPDAYHSVWRGQNYEEALELTLKQFGR